MTILRLLAAVLVRGQDALFIRHDLEEMYARDRARGMPAWRACWRYAYHLIASAYAVWRDGVRWPRLPGVQWLDVKLAGRMLVRYPGLTLVGGMALGIGIPVALAPIQLANAINAGLPFEDGDRIVGLQYWDRADSRRATLHDFERWKRELTSFDPLAAARRRSENIVGEGLVELTAGAEMTASAFAVPRVSPLLGRTLIEADEMKSAPPVVVIGYELWQRQFGGAADVLGRTLRLGRTTRTVVGVMPEGFLFPARDKFWVPIQDRANDYEFGKGPRFWVFGRLRDGVFREEAQAEFTTVGQRIAADHPDTHGTVHAEIVKYAHAITGLRATFDRVYPTYLTSLLLLAVACGNVGTLMLARTAARSNEIAVRNALGAGRGRIVMQLFVESLVLALLAAAAGVFAADRVIELVPVLQQFQRAMPFWFDLGVKPSTVAVAGGLAVFSAVIAGLLPAVKATGKRAYCSLQHQGAGGGLRFGAAATVLIVIEVAIGVAGMSGVASVARGAFRERSLGDGVAPHKYLTAELRLTGSPPDEEPSDPLQRAESVRLAAIHAEISRRLAAEPGVEAVSFASDLPGMAHGRGRIEVDGAALPAAAGLPIVNRANVDRGFFDTLEQRVLVGRGFQPRDLAPGGRPAIVNRSFVEKVLHGQDPLGRRFRYVRPANQPPGPWHEIVGVVGDLGMNIVDPDRSAGVYHVAAPGEINPPQLLVRVGGDAEAFASRLRALLADIEPSLIVRNPVRLDRVFSELLLEAQFTAIMFGLVAVIGVALSAAGLYALMAFSVAQRTREIAIRAALGARPSRIVAAVVIRAMLQLAAGVVLGACAAAVIVPEALSGVTMREQWRQMLAAVSFAMILIGLLACIVPTRRALRIQPVDALKELG